MLSIYPVLPDRGWPRRSGFWRRIEETATAGRGLGLHPAPCPLKSHQGAAHRVAPHSLPLREELHLPASKTQCGPRAERIRVTNGDALVDVAKRFKENRHRNTVSLKSVFFKGIPLKDRALKVCGLKRYRMKPSYENPPNRSSTYRNVFYRSASDTKSCDNFDQLPIDQMCSKARRLLSASFNLTPANQEGGLCNTPLFTDIA